jgi:lantibiotic modifying enzyme
MANENILKLNSAIVQLMKVASELKNQGLLRGKMGICLYFFNLYQKTNKEEYEEFAGQLLDEVYEYLHQNPLSPQFDDGLAGIAWAIDYLVKKDFLEADSDSILNEVDKIIYRYLSDAGEEIPFGIKQGLLGYVFYLFNRFLDRNNKPKENLTGLVFQRLLIDLINRLGIMIEDGKFNFREPSKFDLFWDLPCCLYVLGKVRKQNLYNAKTDRILKDLGPIVLSTFPQYSSNRLALIVAMEGLNMPKWKNHLNLLVNNIAPQTIIDFELKNNNIHLEDGIAGLVFLDSQFQTNCLNAESVFDKNLLIKKIVESGYWNYVKGKEDTEPGLLHGIAGVSWALMSLT